MNHMLIHPELFKVKHTVTASHIRSVRYEDTVDATELRIKELIEETRDIKKDCGDWARANIASDMLVFAASVGLKYKGRPVTNFSDIRKSWKVDPSLDNQKKIFHILYGGFDEKPGWQREKEATYMTLRGYVYKNVGWEGKGCIERMMTCQKNALVGRVNNSTDKTHGLSISIVRPENERSLNPNGRRPKSTFREDFVVRILFHRCFFTFAIFHSFVFCF